MFGGFGLRILRFLVLDFVLNLGRSFLSIMCLEGLLSSHPVFNPLTSTNVDVSGQ